MITRNSFLYAVLVGGCLLLGIVFFLWQQGVLVVYFPWQQRLHGIALHKGDAFQRKTVSLFSWKEGRWKESTAAVLWNEADLVESLRHLINNWIMFVQDEQLVSHALWLRHVAISSLQNEVLLSFNRSLFDRQWSIAQKLSLVEGLLKTIKATGASVEYITFLAQDAYMADDHLDFTKPWPLDGFMQG